jgi:hypothetical protein
LLFTPNTGNQKYCSECRADRQEEINAYNKRMKEAQKIKLYRPFKTIPEVTAELRAYNKKHHTLLKYGKYVQMMENGELGE